MHLQPNIPLPIEQLNTEWRNPTNRRILADVFVGASPMNRSGRFRYVWEPGESRIVPSEYDAAIVQRDQHGAVIGGLAPQLLRNGEDPETRLMAPGIDAEETRRKEAIADAQTALSQKHASEEALLVAAARVQAAKKRDADQDASASANEAPPTKNKK